MALPVALPVRHAARGSEKSGYYLRPKGIREQGSCVVGIAQGKCDRAEICRRGRGEFEPIEAAHRRGQRHGGQKVIRIFITDNGHGISQEDIHHIFKRFYRSKNTSESQGIGLGLPLAKAIVEGQGGILSVQSELLQGTTFTLSFLTES